MKLAIAADHGGFSLKESVKKKLDAMGIAYHDFGTYSEESVDYPDYGIKVAEAVASGEYQRGILVCGTGLGMSIVANKVPGIRCALLHDTFSAKATREHNDTNIMAMGARVIGPGLADDIVEIWLTTEFSGGRHQKRLDKIADVEKRYGQEEGVTGC
ncbi:ribose 5-phosphate isomerase B [Tumebacillus sp. ITR2]|uniref:Ribose 5-phosphate isomerase B n=1 Tax=Tumebacillus amylolyticus TaxID=2801339 RepID=A0ABS1J5U7_9BACL|nr:ribose 5-phosphate isomerase B [Tumebacillus amylolyticus]MBL0385429.1 ribose 5-phosphate isomerase B [Tumebacillus amylolyticus]